MKRIKIAQNRFLRLDRTESESGQTLYYDITKAWRRNRIVLASFQPDQSTRAANVFLLVSDMLKAQGGLPINRRLVRQWVNRSATFQADNDLPTTRKSRRKTKPKAI